MVANAGTAFESIDQLSVDGYDRSFATNHLGHFAFITTLLPLLERTSGINGGDVRVVVTSSMAYQFAGNNGIDFDSIRVKSEGKSILDMKAAGRRYGRSKMANILFTQELSKRLEARGISGIRVNTCHPGKLTLSCLEHTEIGLLTFGRRFDWRYGIRRKCQYRIHVLYIQAFMKS